MRRRGLAVVRSRPSVRTRASVPYRAPPPVRRPARGLRRPPWSCDLLPFRLAINAVRAAGGAVTSKQPERPAPKNAAEQARGLAYGQSRQGCGRLPLLIL